MKKQLAAIGRVALPTPHLSLWQVMRLDAWLVQQLAKEIKSFCIVKTKVLERIDFSPAFQAPKMATLTHFGTCGRFWLIKAPRGVWAKLAWDRCSRSLNSKFGFENDNTLEKMVGRLLIYHFSKLGLRMTPWPMSQGVNYKWAFRRRQMLIFDAFRFWMTISST